MSLDYPGTPSVSQSTDALSDDEEFTDSEVTTIRNFIAMIGDTGVVATMTLRVITDYHGSPAAIKAFEDALEDLTNTCDLYQHNDVRNPDDVYQAAASLALVLRYAAANSSTPSLVIPADFLPSIELVQKCFRMYFRWLASTD